MTKEKLAELLNGRQYRNEITKAEQLEAKESGLIVVFGASDDLIEFRGAIYDEAGASDEEVITISEKGILEKPIQEDLDEEDFEQQFIEYVEAKKRGNKIIAMWDIEGYSWIYLTEIPHSTFEILDEDQERYCRGMVIDLTDLN
jgi:hypothetical protein